MKQVWQAEDGSIFLKEKDCEIYEDSLQDLKSLKDFVTIEYTEEAFEDWLELTKKLCKAKQTVLLRFIKQQENKDAN